jgi:hypothetical protein
MKKILIVALLFLSGCSTLMDAYLMKYDTNEYQQISDIRSSAYYGKLSCDNIDESKDSAISIAKKTLVFKQFVQYIPHNDKVINSSIELDKMAQGLKDQYEKSNKVSAVFCKLKFDAIEKSAEIMQKNIGAKPK